MEEIKMLSNELVREMIKGHGNVEINENIHVQQLLTIIEEIFSEREKNIEIDRSERRILALKAGEARIWLSDKKVMPYSETVTTLEVLYPKSLSAVRSLT